MICNRGNSISKPTWNLEINLFSHQNLNSRGFFIIFFAITLLLDMGDQTSLNLKVIIPIVSFKQNMNLKILAGNTLWCQDFMSALKLNYLHLLTSEYKTRLHSMENATYQFHHVWFAYFIFYKNIYILRTFLKFVRNRIAFQFWSPWLISVFRHQNSAKKTN